MVSQGKVIEKISGSQLLLILEKYLSSTQKQFPLDESYKTKPNFKGKDGSQAL